MKGELLLRVADMLENLPDLVAKVRPNGSDKFRFDMYLWLMEMYDDWFDEEKSTICGTAGCVCGWVSVLMPEVGLTVEPGYGLKFKPADGPTLWDYQAAAKAFDIPCDDARELFGDHNPSDRLEMAKKIRDYVAAYPEVTYSVEA